MTDADAPTPLSEETTLEDRVAVEFLERLVADRAEGVERSLAEYQRLFPGFETRIEREYREVSHADAAPRDAATGSGGRLGAYRLLREIGRGGQGVVYLAEDERLRRRVALKVLASSWTTLSSERSMRLDREAATLARLDHPGLCTVYEAGVSDDGAGRGAAFLAMRYVEGETLARRIAAARERGAPPSDRAAIEDAASRVERVARALHVAHEAGILHRDVKPANVMVTPSGEPVLLDFGLARDEASDLPTLTRADDQLGTPAYMAPEQLDPRRGAVGARADVFALGVTLYESLTLRRPFEGPTRDAVVRATLDEEPLDARRVNARIPRDLAVVVATALEKDPARRYATALDLADDLRRVREREPIHARPAGPWLKLRRWAERHRGVASSLAALLVVLVAGIATTSVLLARTRSALDDVTRLADLKRLHDLHEDADRLYPAEPERVPGPGGMNEWLVRAGDLRARLPIHESTLARLRARALAAPEDAEVGWWLGGLEQLVKELGALPARIEEMETRRRLALDLDRLSIDGHRAAWDETIAAIGDRARFPRYDGLVLAPQRGLVPLGPDRESGHFEFAHVATGRVPERDAATGKLVIDGSCGLVLVLLPGGTFRMGVDLPDVEHPEGSPNVDPAPGPWDSPSHDVTLDPFFLSKFEMTQGQWLRVTGVNPADKQAGSRWIDVSDPLRHPVESISWLDCDRWLPRIGLLVPTEAQWEYAARGGTRTLWWTGNDRQSVGGAANLADRYCEANGGHNSWPYERWLDDGFASHAPVGRFRANPFGLHDTMGNLSEWCRDTWESYDTPARPGDGLRTGNETYRVVRGSDFANSAAASLSASRRGYPEHVPPGTAGIRPARAIVRR